MTMFGGRANPIRLWSQEGRLIWPRDDGAWIFFGRAIDQLGAHLHGEIWRGTEPGLDAVAIATTPTVFDKPKTAFPIIDEMNRLDRFRDDLARSNAVVERLHAALAEGRLRSAYRIERNGAIKECSREWWNHERLGGRFRTCKIAPAWPIGGEGDSWLFVDRTEFQALVAADARPVAAIGSRALAKVECVAWLRRSFEDDPERRLRKLYFKDEAQKRIAGLSARQFEVAWKEAIEGTERHRAGAPKKIIAPR